MQKGIVAFRFFKRLYFKRHRKSNNTRDITESGAAHTTYQRMPKYRCSRSAFLFTEDFVKKGLSFYHLIFIYENAVQVTCGGELEVPSTFIKKN